MTPIHIEIPLGKASDLRVVDADKFYCYGFRCPAKDSLLDEIMDAGAIDRYSKSRQQKSSWLTLLVKINNPPNV